MSVHYGDDNEYALPNVDSKNEKEPAVDYKGSNDNEIDLDEKYPYDPNFNGIDEGRTCTDICMLIIFIVFLCGMLALFFVGLTVSNPKYLYIPTDYRNLLCGYDNSKLKVENAEKYPDLTKYPYLFWTRPGKKGYVRSYCVEQCPDKGKFTDAFQENLLVYQGGEKNAKCNNAEETKRTVRGYKVPFDKEENSVEYYCEYNTSVIMNRCMPTLGAFDESILEIANANFSSMVSTNTLMTAVNDLLITYPYIAVSVVITLVIAFLYVILMRYTATIFVWITVVLAVVASALLTVVCWGQIEGKWIDTKAAEAYSFGLYDEELNHDVFTVLFYICIAWDIILVFLLIFLFGRIKRSIGIIKIVSMTFAQCKTLFIFPIFTYLIMFIWWVYVVGVAIVLFGAGKAKSVQDPELGLMIEYTYDNVIAGFSIYHFIGFIWVSIFINDLSEVALAGVFASWYFAREPRRENMGKSPVWESFKRAIRYHTGSVAFGSLIITIIKLIRMAIEYVREKTKDTDNDAVKCILKCFACCCWCFEKFMKYINRNAYILIAVHGYNFFTAGTKAFGLLLRNCINVATINWVGDFTLFLGRIFITGIVTSISCFIFASIEDVTFFVVPSAIVAVAAFFVSNAFTGLFEMGIDSMFLCYMEDIERNDGSAGHELYGPPELIDHLTKKEQPKEE